MIHDDLLLTSTVRRRVHLEAGGDSAWIAMRRTNGEIVTRGQLIPTMPMVIYGRGLVTALNTRIPEGGAWIVGWTHGGDRLMALWLDQDGDVRFTVENDEDSAVIIAAGIDDMVRQCFDAIQHLRMSDAALDRRSDQTYKRAQGEPAPSVRR
jgi:hypothetical protein